MVGRTQTARLLQIALGFLLAIGLFPMSSVMHMQVGYIGMTPATSAIYGGASAGNNAPNLCCNDTINPLSLTCGGLIPHFAFATHSAGTQQIAISPFFTQISHPEIVTPPPKI